MKKHATVQSAVAQFLQEQRVFDKTAAGVRGLVGRHAGKALMGAAGMGAAGTYALKRSGRNELQSRQEAAELNQLLEAYPELLYTTPTAFDQRPPQR